MDTAQGVTFAGADNTASMFLTQSQDMAAAAPGDIASHYHQQSQQSTDVSVPTDPVLSLAYPAMQHASNYGAGQSHAHMETVQVRLRLRPFPNSVGLHKLIEQLQVNEAVSVDLVGWHAVGWRPR